MEKEEKFIIKVKEIMNLKCKKKSGYPHSYLIPNSSTFPKFFQFHLSPSPSLLGFSISSLFDLSASFLSLLNVELSTEMTRYGQFWKNLKNGKKDMSFYNPDENSKPGRLC